MLVIHACCLCALLVCVVNGKSECCLGGCFVLLHLLRIYECDVAMHGEERWRERWEVGPAVVAACELPQSSRGSEHGCVLRRWWWGQRTRRCRASGEASESERDGEWVGDANAMVHNKLKRGS
jgi:hypothetical protein